MRRVTVQNAFQVLSIFYLFVTCFCSSLNVDANIKGVLPTESPNNDSVLASQLSTKVSQEKKIPSQPSSIPSSEKSSENPEREKTHDSSEVHVLPEAVADVKSVPEVKEVGTNTEATTNASDASPEKVIPSLPPSTGSEAKKESTGTPSAQPTEENGATVEAPTISDPTTSESPPQDPVQQPEKQTREVGGQTGSSPDNGTSREREGEQPEDGSDVPTFDEYQRKFTSGGSPAKEGGGGKKTAPGESAARSESDGAKSKEEGDSKTDGGVTTGGSGRSQPQSFKNIGSHNCGAKVISHNNEASNPAYVLNENRDEYMNNPCAVKKWIVVETCEPVRLRKIEMASYELFSSMVKTFRVSSSERFPQKMWDVVGTFVAKNEKGVQTYATEQEKYYKYFKFEFVDHYGNEHFCPVSLIRLFGVLMEDDDGEEEAPDAPEAGGVNGGGGEEEAAAVVRVGKNKEPASRSLLQSAKEVIVGIVQNTLRPSSTFKEGHAEAAALSNAFSANATDGATSDPPAATSRPAVEGPRVMHLMRMLLSGDYSGLLQRCLELLRQAPPVVHQNYVEHKIIPSPSVAFAACAKAMQQTKISAEELRWAYLTFNNDTFPWEDRGGSAAITAKLGEQQSGEKKEEPHSASPAHPPPPPADAPAAEASKPPIEARVEEKQKVQDASGDTAKSAADEASKTAVESPKQPLETVKASAVEKEAEAPVGKPQSEVLHQPASSLTPPPPVQIETPKSPEAARSDEQRGGTAAEAPKEADVEQKKAPPSEQQNQPQQQEQQQKQAVEPPKEQEKPAQSEPQKEKEQPPTPPKEQSQQKQPTTPPKAPKAASGEGSNGRSVGLKENAYMRLSNKVRDLERNITMSMRYLDELSRSYKKKTDKLSKQQDKTTVLLDETRARVEKLEQRAQALEAEQKAVREILASEGLAELRREHARMRKELMVQVLAFNIIVIFVHCFILFLCRKRCCRPHAVAVNGSTRSTRAALNTFTAIDDPKTESLPLAHSNSEGNLCIVDPPFRFDDTFVKKDQKKRRKKKRSNAGVHPMADRSSSVSRIEQLVL